MKTKSGSISTKKLIADIINLILFTCLAVTGIIIQLRYHIGGGEFLSYSEIHIWRSLRDIHVILSFLALAGLIYHHILNKSLLKHLFLKKEKRSSGKFRISGTLTVVASLAAITGICSYIFYLFGEMNTRLHIMEIHDKLGIIISILFIVHFVQHFRQLTVTLKKRISNRNAREA